LASSAETYFHIVDVCRKPGQDKKSIKERENVNSILRGREIEVKDKRAQEQLKFSMMQVCRLEVFFCSLFAVFFSLNKETGKSVINKRKQILEAWVLFWDLGEVAEKKKTISS
jgi:hypothetical protein